MDRSVSQSPQNVKVHGDDDSDGAVTKTMGRSLSNFDGSLNGFVGIKPVEWHLLGSKGVGEIQKRKLNEIDQRHSEAQKRRDRYNSSEHGNLTIEKKLLVQQKHEKKLERLKRQQDNKKEKVMIKFMSL